MISLTPRDACCFQILDSNEHIGVWCPQSHRVVVDGNLLGFASSQEEVIERLHQVQVPAWELKDKQPKE